MPSVPKGLEQVYINNEVQGGWFQPPFFYGFRE